MLNDLQVVVGSSMIEVLRYVYALTLHPTIAGGMVGSLGLVLALAFGGRIATKATNAGDAASEISLRPIGRGIAMTGQSPRRVGRTASLTITTSFVVLAACPADAQLVYHQGPVRSKPTIYNIFWGSQWACTYPSAGGPCTRLVGTPSLRQQLDRAWKNLVANADYFFAMQQYDASGWPFAPGSWLGSSVVESEPPISSTDPLYAIVNDLDIQRMIQTEIDAARIPPNDPSTIYVVYLPPGVQAAGSLNAPGPTCEGSPSLCGYHSYISEDGGPTSDIAYAVIPYVADEKCSFQCSFVPGTTDPLALSIPIASHEIAEAATDPVPSGPYGGWYGSSEIADPCALTSTIAGYPVVGLWSNKVPGCLRNPPRVVLADFDGDGRADAAFYDSAGRSWWVGHSRTLCFGGPPVCYTKFDFLPWATTPDVSNSRDRVFVGDFDGDGRDDVLVDHTADGTLRVGLARGSSLSFSTFASAIVGNVPDAPAFVGDFDGDGRADLAFVDQSAGQVYLGLSDGSQFHFQAESINLPSDDVGVRPFAGDFTGTGRLQLGFYVPPKRSWRRKAKGSWWRLGSPDPAAGTLWRRRSLRTGGTPANDINDPVLIADFNGDGADDIAFFRGGDSSWHVEASSCATRPCTLKADVAFSMGVPFPDDYSSARLFTGDLDGDGKSDILLYHGIDRTWWKGISNGEAFNFTLAARTDGTSGPDLGDNSGDMILLGDVSGDGRVDVVVHSVADALHGAWWIGEARPDGSLWFHEGELSVAATPPNPYGE